MGESQCTFWCSVLSDVARRPSAFTDNQSQCTFWCSVLSDPHHPRTRLTKGDVSMHLLVLSAFRLRLQKTASQRRLPERNRRRPGKCHIESARTCPIKPHNREIPPQTTPAPPTAPTSQYAADFQRAQAKKPTPHNYAAVDTATKATDDCPLHRHDGLLPADRPTRADRRFPPTALLGPTAVSRRPPRPVGRRAPTIRRFHVNRRPPLAQPRWTK